MSVAPVSVIIPAYNAAGLVGEAIESVLTQTCRPQEIIVVDDGSTDDTRSVVTQFDSVLYIQQSNQGAAEARNVGALRATSPFICFLDADDIWPADRIERQLPHLATDPTIDLVSGAMVQFRRAASGEIIRLSNPAPSNLPSVVLMRSEAFRRVGPFSSAWAVGETIEWVSRAVDAGLRWQSIGDVVLLRRVHERNLGKTVEAPSREYLHMVRAVMMRRRGRQGLDRNHEELEARDAGLPRKL